MVQLPREIHELKQSGLQRRTQTKTTKINHVNLVCQTCLETVSYMYSYVTRFGSKNPSAKMLFPRDEREQRDKKKTSTLLTVASRTVPVRGWSQNNNEGGTILAKPYDDML